MVNATKSTSTESAYRGERVAGSTGPSGVACLSNEQSENPGSVGDTKGALEMKMGVSKRLSPRRRRKEERVGVLMAGVFNGLRKFGSRPKSGRNGNVEEQEHNPKGRPRSISRHFRRGGRDVVPKIKEKNTHTKAERRKRV